MNSRSRAGLCPRALLALALAFAPGASAALAQSRAGAGDATAGAQAAETTGLSAEEEKLVSGSRAAILAAGLSPRYFDAHIRLFKVVNTAGDRRVVWRFAVNEHEATINDAVGFYTDAQGQLVFTHSVTGLLAPAHDVRRTITRRRAERVMRACIGGFAGGSVSYQKFGSPPRAALVFSAVSLPLPAAPVASAKQQQPPAAAQRKEEDPERDRIGGGKKKPFLLIGTIDLETGRCTKGVAQTGSPLPPTSPPRPRRPR